MVRDGAILSKKAGIPHFSLLTSKGSNANIWANDWKITHGLLYLKVKGDAEQAVIKEEFDRISIFRPGVLGREGESGGIMSKLPVRNLAAVMIYDAESDEIKQSENDQDQDKKMVDEPMEKIEAVSKDNDDADVDKEKVVEEEKKTEKVGVEQVKDIIIYEADDIDNVMVMAMKNFNGVCGESKVDEIVKEEVKTNDEVDENVDKAKEEEVVGEDEDKDKVEDVVVKEEENKDDGDKEEDVEQDQDQDKEKEKENEEDAPKYEVVEKPKEDEENEENVNEDEPKKEEENVEIAKDDYVEIDKADASKEDVNGGEE